MNVEFLLIFLFDKVNMTMAECPFVFFYLFCFLVFLRSLLGSQGGNGIILLESIKLNLQSCHIHDSRPTCTPSWSIGMRHFV